MNPYECQKSRSFSDLGSRSLGLNVHQISNIFSSETKGPIQVRFYIEHLCVTGTKVYISGPGHMTKMAVMPIYGKNNKTSREP